MLQRLLTGEVLYLKEGKVKIYYNALSTSGIFWQYSGEAASSLTVPYSADTHKLKDLLVKDNWYDRIEQPVPCEVWDTLTKPEEPKLKLVF